MGPMLRKQRNQPKKNSKAIETRNKNIQKGHKDLSQKKKKKLEKLYPQQKHLGSKGRRNRNGIDTRI
jgi:hypothetical protein